MKTVKVKKLDLLEIIRKNRHEHRAKYNKAFEGYRKECIIALEANLEALRQGKSVVHFTERPPEDHTADYDRAIAMLDMSVDDVVEIFSREFQEYVQDDWDWKEEWMASNSKYYANQ